MAHMPNYFLEILFLGDFFSSPKRKIRILPLVFVLLLAACQPTPPEDVVVNKAEGALQQQIAATAAPEYRVSIPIPESQAAQQPAESPAETGLQAALGAPEHLTDTVSGKVYGGTMDVKIDATVTVPNVSAVPVYRAALTPSSPEEKEQIARAILGDEPYIYRQNHRLWNESNIRYYQAWLDALDDQPYGPGADYDQMRAWLTNQIEAHQLGYQQADACVKEQPWPGNWRDSGGSVMVDDGRTFHWADGGLLKFRQEGTPWLVGAMRHDEPRTDDERAADEAAVAFLSQLHSNQVTLWGVAAHDESWRRQFGVETGFDNGLYQLWYLPVYGGIPVYPWETYHGTDNGLQDAGISFDRNAAQERIEVVTDHGEVAEVTWTSPLRVLGVENENVGLLPFDRIMEIFKQQIFMNIYMGKDYLGNDSHTDMRITEITLSYMRVRKPNQTEYWLLPVWDFQGYDTRFAANRMDDYDWWDTFSLLTVNAIDGSIVDRNLGY